MQKKTSCLLYSLLFRNSEVISVLNNSTKRWNFFKCWTHAASPGTGSVSITSRMTPLWSPFWEVELRWALYRDCHWLWTCHLSVYSVPKSLFVLLCVTGAVPSKHFFMPASTVQLVRRGYWRDAAEERILSWIWCVFFFLASALWGLRAPPGRVLPSKCTSPPASFPASLGATFQQGSLAAQWVASKLVLLTSSPLQPCASVANSGSQPHPLQQSDPQSCKGTCSKCVPYLGHLPWL